VIALVRDINKAASKLPAANVQLVQGDIYQYATIPGALKGCDAVICAASTRDVLDPLGPFKVDFSVSLSAMLASRARYCWSGISLSVLRLGIRTVCLRQRCLDVLPLSLGFRSS